MKSQTKQPEPAAVARNAAPQTPAGVAATPAQKTQADPAAIEALLLKLLGKTAGEPTAEQVVRSIARRIAAQKYAAALTVEDLLAEIRDALQTVVQRQVNAILHQPRLQALEARWRGALDLVEKADADSTHEVFLLPATEKDLEADRKAAKGNELASELYRKLVDQQYGMAGGQPYAAVVTDMAFGPQQGSITLLQHIAKVCEHGHIVFLAQAAPALFRQSDYRGIAGLKTEQLRELSKSQAWRAFKDFQATPESRHAYLFVNRAALRAPYKPGSSATEARELPYFAESDDRHEDYLWGAGPFLMARAIAASFDRSGVGSHVCGRHGGGWIDRLPALECRTTGETRPPLEFAPTDALENAIADLGFICPAHYRNTTGAVFFGAPSAHQPVAAGDAQMRASATLGARLQYVLLRGRMAHYLKTILRDQVNNHKTPAEIKKLLETWISQYVVSNADASPAEKERCPLSEARIESVVNQNGTYRGDLILVPHQRPEKFDFTLWIAAA